MASFLEDLWGSIFTPGPTPPLLVATNAAFAALQLVLLTLLIITYSIHFLMLLLISGGLWWAINWFAKEVQIAQARDGEEKQRQSRESERGDVSVVDEARDGADSGLETETEDEMKGQQLRDESLKRQSANSIPDERRDEAAITAPDQSTTLRTWRTGATASLAPTVVHDTLRQRKSLAESTGDVSTDSEWERVDNER